MRKTSLQTQDLLKKQLNCTGVNFMGKFQ